MTSFGLESSFGNEYATRVERDIIVSMQNGSWSWRELYVESFSKCSVRTNTYVIILMQKLYIIMRTFAVVFFFFFLWNIVDIDTLCVSIDLGD